MTSIDVFRYQKWLKTRIGSLERMQEQRRELTARRVAEMNAVLARKDLEIANLRAQLVQ